MAQGEQIPKALYFCLHVEQSEIPITIGEYKPEEGTSNDPLGQLLMAMVAAQQTNIALKEQNIPIYGTYVLGRYFYFVLLQEKEYVVSESYSATKEDLYAIFAILRKAKAHIEQLV